MNPNTLDFTKSPLSSPINTPKRRVLGEIQSSPLFRPKDSPTIERLKKTPIQSPQIQRSPLTRKSNKITRIFEDRSKFKMSNKENYNETFIKIDVEEETRDFSFNFPSCSKNMSSWSTTKLDFTDLQSKFNSPQKENIFVPEKEIELDPEIDTLHDLEEEFDSHNFDTCNKYEIISTDSPDIISNGRRTSRKITSKNFSFGAPLSDNEQSTSFNKPNEKATRMLNFEDDSFEFTSPIAKRSNISVKKSLKFNETPTKVLRHEKSDSSIGSMSPISTKLRIYPSESTTSMESGFISELEEPFLDIDEISNSPKMANFNELLSGTIKNSFDETDFTLRRPLQRSLSYNPAKAKVSLFSISESPKKNNKRCERSEEENVCNKRRKSNCESPEVMIQRPVFQRAFSENSASIMSALARSAVEPDLIGDFSQAFALPLTSGDHTDLKSVSCETLAALLRGEYHDSVAEFKVIDCRYPYEFEGGHIVGAINIYTQEQVLCLINQPLQDKGDKRNILVFHCEFSLERGPKLSRFLRSSDRAVNSEHYPSLHYPEVYLLHEGYRAFYRRYPDMCSPAGYTAMLDPRHRHLLRRHRSTKSRLLM